MTPLKSEPSETLPVFGAVVGSAQVALPTKQQKPPHRIKFLQERLDHSWDVHAIGSDVGVMCVKRGYQS
jgi:hypothetical protein